jgi:protein-disulfide isomerase
MSPISCILDLPIFPPEKTTQFPDRCFEMTLQIRLLGSAVMVALAVSACSKPEVSEGSAAAAAPSATTASQMDPRVAVADTARIMGDPSAKVWLVMASDFQCPACKAWHDRYSTEIMRDYVATGKVRFAYTNYPIDHLHPHARAAAEAAMCAAAQGKFWGIHDRLFATQGDWAAMSDPTVAFGKLAAESGVDMSAWNQCLADHVMLPMIEGDQSRGRNNGVDQTPYFFIGERKVGGAVPASFLRKLLDSALAQAGGPSR